MQATSVSLRAVLICGFLALAAAAPPSAQAQKELLGDPLDRATTYFARYFECNGTYQERYDTWWLSTANPFKFRRYFTATWYFDGLDASLTPGSVLVARLDFAVYGSAKEAGGKPTAASIDFIVRSPDREAQYEVPNVRVEMNADETSIPTYVYFPLSMLSADGRLIVEVHGLGQIGVGQARLRLLAPLEAY